MLARAIRSILVRPQVGHETIVTEMCIRDSYKSKEELFDALVAEPYNTLMKRFLKAQDTFATLPPEEQPANMGNISGECMDWMVDYIYEHLNAFQLLLCCAEGTRYEQFLHTLAEIEVDATHPVSYTHLDVYKRQDINRKE